MVNTRAKIKKTQNVVQTCSEQQASVTDDPDSQQPTESGIVVGSNDDLLTQILLRLPAKSILRFKSVSKSWLALLSHRHFTILYDKLSISCGLFVHNLYYPFDVENQLTAPPFRSLDFYSDIYGIRIVQSCNGLLLCCSDRVHPCRRKYYVFNPTTKQFAIIPPIPENHQDGRKLIHFICLAYHQTDCVHYKIFCLITSRLNRKVVQIQIYSSDTGQWTISDQSFDTFYCRHFSLGVYWNGGIYWGVSYVNPLCFMLDVQQLQTFPLPRWVVPFVGNPDHAMPLYFGESLGHLHMVDTTPGEDHYHLNVYEMLNDRSGWFVKYQVDLHELTLAYPEMIRTNQYPSIPNYCHYEVLDVVRGEREEDTFMVIGVPVGKIIRYNILGKTFKQISDMGMSSYRRIGNVHRYTQTITSF